MELIKKQNQCMNNTNIKIIKQYEIRKNNRIYDNAIAEVEPNAVTKILPAEKINICWEHSKVYNGIKVCCIMESGFTMF